MSVSPVALSGSHRARPILRGWSHALATLGAAGLTVALVLRCLGDAPRLSSMLLYGLTSIALFGTSALYHVVTWTPSRRKVMRALDHGNIYIMIAATTTAIGWNVLEGWERIALLASVWGIALIGVAVSVFHIRLSRGMRLGLYIGTGFTGVIALPGLLEALPPLAISLLVGGGLIYAAGGFIYAMKRPNPFPSVFGYHEIFHLMVIVGALAFAVVIWVWVVPFART